MRLAGGDLPALVIKRHLAGSNAVSALGIATVFD
jgi:hypothetical protein